MFGLAARGQSRPSTASPRLGLAGRRPSPGPPPQPTATAAGDPQDATWSPVAAASQLILH
jgi:hypothetical protein